MSVLANFELPYPSHTGNRSVRHGGGRHDGRQQPSSARRRLALDRPSAWRSDLVDRDGKGNQRENWGRHASSTGWPVLQLADGLRAGVRQLDRRLAAMVKQNRQMLAVQAIPGIGPLSATALVATATDITAFKSGRQFAAWLGLTPRQIGTGGKTQQLGISKRGDAYVRSLLIHGARSIVSRSLAESWIGQLKQRRHFNVAVAALANKMAPTAWAVLASAFDVSQVGAQPICQHLISAARHSFKGEPARSNVMGHRSDRSEGIPHLPLGQRRLDA